MIVVNPNESNDGHTYAFLHDCSKYDRAADNGRSDSDKGLRVPGIILDLASALATLASKVCLPTL